MKKVRVTRWNIDDEQGDSRFTAGKGDAWGANVNVTGTRHITLASITAYGD